MTEPMSTDISRIRAVVATCKIINEAIEGTPGIELRNKLLGVQKQMRTWKTMPNSLHPVVCKFVMDGLSKIG